MAGFNKYKTWIIMLYLSASYGRFQSKILTEKQQSFVQGTDM